MSKAKKLIEKLVNESADKNIGRSWLDATGNKKTITMITNLGGKPTYLVSKETDRPGMGELISVDNIESEIAWDKKAYDSHMRMQQKSREIEDREAAEKAELENLYGFDKQFSPRMRQRVLNTLTKQVSINRKFNLLKTHIENMVKDGAEIGNYKKFGDVLEISSGGFLSQQDLTKFGLDYAKYLIDKRIRIK